MASVLNFVVVDLVIGTVITSFLQGEAAKIVKDLNFHYDKD